MLNRGSMFVKYAVNRLNMMLEEKGSNMFVEIVQNIKPKVAKQLNMCAFYAIIPSELIKEFNAL